MMELILLAAMSSLLVGYLGLMMTPSDRLLLIASGEERKRTVLAATALFGAAPARVSAANPARLTPADDHGS